MSLRLVVDHERPWLVPAFHAGAAAKNAWIREQTSPRVLAWRAKHQGNGEALAAAEPANVEVRREAAVEPCSSPDVALSQIRYDLVVAIVVGAVVWSCVVFGGGFR